MAPLALQASQSSFFQLVSRTGHWVKAWVLLMKIESEGKAGSRGDSGVAGKHL